VGATTPQALPLPDKPSIAVLPFVNLSGDPEQDYFVDGMVEESSPRPLAEMLGFSGTSRTLPYLTPYRRAAFRP
jgi:hypothetical protein